MVDTTYKEIIARLTANISVCNQQRFLPPAKKKVGRKKKIDKIDTRALFCHLGCHKDWKFTYHRSTNRKVSLGTES